MKKRRHAKILELIEAYAIDTQEELLRLLRENGFEVTQATVSRDIKELRLIKTLTEDGSKYRYSVAGETRKDFSGKFYALMSDSALSVLYAGNMVVIKTMVGMAQAICASMDTLPWQGIVGTLAGDDTIFIVVQDEELARKFSAELNEMIG